MTTLPPNATQDEIEEELAFQHVMIESLDSGADDYDQRLSEVQTTIRALEGMMEAYHGGSRPQTAQSHNYMDGVDGAHNQNNASWQGTLDGHPGSNGGHNGDISYGGPYGVQSTSMKRPFPQSSSYFEHPSKRATPDPSTAVTPTSSVESFELVDNPNSQLGELALRRHQQAEDALRRQRAARAADEEFARYLSEQEADSRVSASSSSRPSVQTTLNHNGSYQRPPPHIKSDGQSMRSSQPYGYNSNGSQSYRNHMPNQVYGVQQQTPYIKSEPSIYGQQQTLQIKPEPTYPRQQNLVQRPRVAPEIVDLTNSDSEDEDVSEIAPNHFTPNSRIPAPAVQPVRRQLPPLPNTMPGSYPRADANGNHYVYGSANQVTRQQPNSWMRQANPLLANAVNGIRNVAGTLSDSFTELSNLIQGASSRPMQVRDDDDDLVYGGSRQLQPGLAPHAGYNDLDQYRSRYDAIANYDPAKTTEEINALLENIRPDEDMPAHLRVQTPEAMNVQLHKYQELGLTWLQKCEEGSNKGGILADDMGLGKTIQMLSLIVTHRSEDPRCKTTLIVAPVALMRQWKQEIEQKVKPGRHKLSVIIHHGANKRKNFRDLQVYDIVLTTFGSLASELKKMERYHLRKKDFPETRPSQSEKCALIDENAQWYRVILDEAQCIKNVSTQTAKAACLLRARYRFCMTGTPMMNNVDELYSLIKFLRIKPYMEWTKFRYDFSTPLKSGHEQTREKSMRMLQTLCKAIMLRRTKKSTYEGKPILVLPERTTEIENPEFSEAEWAVYKHLEQQSRLEFNEYLREGTVGQSYSAILVLLLRLRQACCHPHLIKDFGVSAAADVTPETLIELARKLDPQVITRIKSTGGNFECPVCYDAVPNPAIFLPCGHDACADCFARIADPANAIRDGNENGTGGAKCPNCRGPINPKQITDFDAFKKVHMPDLLTEEEQDALRQQLGLEENEDSETDSEDDSSTDEDEIDAKGNLKDFIVNDDDDSETESEAEEEGVAGPSKTSKGKGKKSQKSKKGKGKMKEKKKTSKAVTMAEMKKLANRNAKARKAYIRRLRRDWKTSAKIEKTLEKLKEIMEDPEGEKVLVFSQWTSLLDLLEVPIDREGWVHRRYDGSMTAQMRGDAVEDMKDPKKGVRIMLVSLKAGNAGLNLNMASQVIILDPFWNPYIEEQAIDRAHRIGQAREVKVHRMLIQNTVEDRIIELQEKKRALISEALDEKASQNIARLGVQELAYLFGVTRNPTQRIQYVPRQAR